MNDKTIYTVRTINAETTLDVTNRVEFRSQETEYSTLDQNITLKTFSNRAVKIASKLLTLTFSEDIQPGNYTIGQTNSPFSKVQYTEEGEVIELNDNTDINYTAIAGSIKVAVTKINGNTQYNFELDLKFKHKDSNPELSVTGTSKVNVIYLNF
jgi:hypothetical protein